VNAASRLFHRPLSRYPHLPSLPLTFLHLLICHPPSLPPSLPPSPLPRSCRVT
jgi:hypothetical protein